MPFLRGLVVRVGLGALPLIAVILLCCLMMGWPGRARGPNTLLPPQSELAAQAAVVPPSERLALPNAAQNNDTTPMAHFQSHHIEHAHIHVPN
jgi:hypothetical protein